MAMRGSRLPVGSTAWITEERSAAAQITRSEVEEFTFSVRNDFDWLNEHMAGIFDENEINVAELFKTPGKLRGKTPMTARKLNAGGARVPLSDIFSATPKGAQNALAQKLNQQSPPKFAIKPSNEASGPMPPSPARPLPQSKHTARTPIRAVDSGYHGSQSIEEDGFVFSDGPEPHDSPSPIKTAPRVAEHVVVETVPVAIESRSPTRTKILNTPEDTFQTAREDQTTRVLAENAQKPTQTMSQTPARSPFRDAHHASKPLSSPASPLVSSPLKTSPSKFAESNLPTSPSKVGSPKEPAHESSPPREFVDDENVVVHNSDDSQSPSDGSSPIRPIVRKSSLNFASLPAREPLNSNKSIGARVSRISHLDQIRTSYYSRPTGGKSLGTTAHPASDDEDIDMTVDAESTAVPAPESDENAASSYNKAYTQRLQDQINMLGQSQSKTGRPSKSIANLNPRPSTGPDSQVQPSQPSQPLDEKPTSPRKLPMLGGPGAFPEDDEDDWIDPPQPQQSKPLPAPPTKTSEDKHHAAVGQPLPKNRPTAVDEGGHLSPRREPAVPDRTTSVQSPVKSTSASVVTETSAGRFDAMPVSPKKFVSVSNPPLSIVPETERPGTPKSPSRTFRDSPLKQVKNKLSSILKSSKGLLASSAAISAEGKSSILSPSSTRLGMFPAPSTESLVRPPTLTDSLYPDLSHFAGPAEVPGSPRPNSRRTRASAEKERKEKMKEKEAKLMAGQMDKLEKAREKEREKARVFSQEQERLAALEKQVAMQREQQQKEQEKRTISKETPKPTRTSPRRIKAQDENTNMADIEDDVEMVDAPAPVPPPSAARATGPGHALRNKELKRPMKPMKETTSRAKAAPTVIKVNMGSQFHPANAISNLHETPGPSNSSQAPLSSKASKASLHPKSSMQSLKGSSATGRPRALDLAARKKEQEERDAQRKREAKLEIERKRTMMQEEERRQEQSRRAEAERQKEKERELAEAKKSAQRQAAIERAKQTRAPPPAVRPQASQAEFALAPEKRGDAGPSRPPSRMTVGSQRSQEDLGKPVNAVLSNTSKAPLKRTAPDTVEATNIARNPPARNGPTYQAKDSKRRRTSETFDGEVEMPSQPNIKGPPVRPSGGFRKDLPTKPILPSAYGGGAGTVGATRDLFKATVTAQHNSAVKASHPLDMAQVSKGAIPFAPNPNAPQKTPGRPGGVAAVKSAAKSTQRSSPRFQNGESIDLPEIQTDDDDDDDDEGPGLTAAWADSPDLRRALMRQEGMDPTTIFGPPAPLNMEEVFSKSKERFHKFRARTSSANWSGADRLTEEDIRKDLAARDRLRREGGWTYDLGRDVV